MKKTLLFALFFSSTAFADWQSKSELGFVSQSGNTNQENSLLKTEITKKSGKNSYKINGEYINSSGETAGSTETERLAESAAAGLKYTREISEKAGLFTGFLWEKNSFAGFDDRYSGDAGLKYTFTKTKRYYFLNETGYRYRSQFEATLGDRVGDKTESNFGRVYFEYGRDLTETSKFRFWVENLIDFSESDNYEVNFEPSLDVAIGEFFSSSKPARVSLKLAYKGMYDNVPAADGLKRYDSIVSTSLNVLY